MVLPYLWLVFYKAEPFGEFSFLKAFFHPEDYSSIRKYKCYCWWLPNFKFQILNILIPAGVISVVLPYPGPDLLRLVGVPS